MGFRNPVRTAEDPQARQDAAAALAAATNAQAAADSALAAAGDAQATADGKVRSFFQTTAPTGLVAGDAGDLWFDTDDANRLHRWSGSAWILSADTRISDAITKADNAQATADGKIVTYYQTGAPAGAGVGDLWVDTDSGNRLHRWDGAAWIDSAARVLTTGSSGQRVRISETGGVQGGGLVELFPQAGSPATLQAGSDTDGPNVALHSPPTMGGRTSVLRLTGADYGTEGVWLGSVADIYLEPAAGGRVDVRGGRLTTVGTPTAGTDAATKDYTDGRVRGVAVTITTNASGDFTLSHGLGRTPTAVTITSRVLGVYGGHVFAISNLTSTAVQGRAYYNDAANPSATITAYLIAL